MLKIYFILTNPMQADCKLFKSNILCKLLVHYVCGVVSSFKVGDK